MAGTPAEQGPEAGAKRRAWAETHRRLSAAGIDALGADDLERLAVASYLIAADDDAAAAWEAKHRRHLAAAEPADAALSAFWAAFCAMLRGQMARAGGWLSRARNVMGDDLDCRARGYVLIPELLQALDANEPERSVALAIEARAIAERFDDADLRAFAMLGHGQALVARGSESQGLALFDELMLSVCAGEVGPIVSGIVYCAVLLECVQLFDLARASEWTSALTEWCESQPDLVTFRGQCLVHRSQLQQAAGEWPVALATVLSARERLADPPHPALGLACYQEGELHRLRGDLVAATDAYSRANRAGFPPMPGVALVELARGNVAAAMAAIGRAVAEARNASQRPSLLAAQVEISIAAHDVATARAAADELLQIAARSRSEVLGALADQATGAALLAAGEAQAAMTHLRAASGVWQRLTMPYQTAQSAMLLGRGCAALGDAASAALEYDRAGSLYEALGANPDAALVRSLAGDAESDGRLLSPREIEVLALVAEGRTSREIADALTISPHTVRRHIENIFTKLGVTSRAAATAYAYEHDLF